ncbi:aldo/keto reductase [Lentimicrobium sp.]|jgi:diketogulonate reductase-like aldo/keto reductase|uniref:aldo/keto reductase n=1 Tax=Lentimicrobium sp. TaxID=2034841 RepID=UPI0025D7CFB1|nr:aldo/keto reductase [Lentimicrobium sp.]MCO5255724.1 aldo/keto reductase [Lentimicrobium sp.]HPF63837.1 aldo/keto reductase [Lentimicrobium sp.]HPJ62258.1 aldo/keto reductase [Lentimicrobium sp.]HPR26039.1 aldo/keto reductase [Lentimicrobium sp.]HRW68610.1 aldo/keto reductase [Lentimicrobium sp.]
MKFPSTLNVFRLNSGAAMPVVGLGVYQMPNNHLTQKAVDNALKNGYRHIDTAAIYHNEEVVGKAMVTSLIPREQVFVTTKLWNSDHGYDHAIKACHASLARLGLDYVDLYLIHWPVQGKRKDTWRALETLLEDGKCKSIGVSNYMAHHLEELLGYCKVPPAVNQIELHPYIFSTRAETIDLCRNAGIIPVAYSPLTKGVKLGDPRLQKIASKYGKSTAQLLIRWALQQGFAAIPKSSVISRIIENINVFDFEISANDMEELNSLDENLVTGWDPAGAL